MRFFSICMVLVAVGMMYCNPKAENQQAGSQTAVADSTTQAIVKSYVPTRFITKGPKHHWFGYYDKLEFDPSGRYILANEIGFEGRSPNETDELTVGMVDIEDGDKWIPLGTSKAWGWQQGCMLQFLPNSKNEVIWNDREEDRFVSHIVNIETMEKRTLPFAIYALSPDGVHAITTDFERINNLRRGYGYAGIEDPNADEIAPNDAGIYLCNLQTGEKKLIISLAQMMDAKLPDTEGKFAEYSSNMHWFNHLLFNTDGTRFIFLHRWKTPDNKEVGGFGTLMYTSDLAGKDIRLVDVSGYTSHFVWRDPEHIMAWTRIAPTGDGFYLFKDEEGGTPQLEGEGIMTRNGHNTYLTIDYPDWILNDEYPNPDRVQQVYLYHVPSKKRIPIGDFYLDPKYKGEWRVDTHPRSGHDGTKVVVDCPNGDQGRQLVLMDISGIVKK